MTTAPNRLAALLQNYMWGQRPPLTVARFARQIGIAHGTVYNWMNGTSRPEMGTLAIVAEKTGLALNDLLEAAGYPVIETEAEVDSVFSFIISEARSGGIYQGEALEAFIAHMEELRARYKALVAQRQPARGRSGGEGRPREDSDSRPKMTAGV